MTTKKATRTSMPRVPRTCYVIGYLEKATGRLVRIQTASAFPVTQAHRHEHQVLIGERYGGDYDEAERAALRSLSRGRLRWARPYLEGIEELRLRKAVSRQ